MDSKRDYFATLINGDHPLSDNDYVAGRISSALRLLCDTETVVCYGLIRDDGEAEACYVVVTTDEKYAKFKEVVQGWYPGLCEFEYPFNGTKAAREWVKKERH